MNSPDTQTIRIALVLLALASCLLLLPARAQAGNGPFNGKIAFQSLRLGTDEIFAINANGTGLVNLSNNTADDRDPAWSPDGTKLAFSRAGEIFVMNADGSNQARLTFVIGTDRNPSWSPDGTKIAFSSDRDGNFEIYLMNADGTSQTRLTNVAGTDAHPAWSPDGTKIVFNSFRINNDNGEIFVMNADGTNQTRLTNNTVLDSRPSFSPDGTKIVFQHEIGNDIQIVVMDANGSRLTQLTSTGSNFDASFSPDGTQIAFTSDRDSNSEIYSMDADGSNEVRLTNNPNSDTYPAWQPIPKLDTIGVFRPSTGQFLLRNFNSAGAPNLTITFGQSGDQPLAGDWDGNGIDEVGVFRNGQFLLRQATFGLVGGHPGIIVTIITINFGQAGDLAIVGDWDGDGIDTPGIFRPSTGQFRLANGTNTNNSSPATAITVFFGQSGDKPVAGDWNNDGIDTIGVYREAAGCSFFLSNNNSTVDITAANFCGVGPITPIVGDWNANGVDTIGIYSGSLAAFSLSNSNSTLNGAAEIQIGFGQGGDLPVAGDWNGRATP